MKLTKSQELLFSAGAFYSLLILKGQDYATSREAAYVVDMALNLMRARGEEDFEEAEKKITLLDEKAKAKAMEGAEAGQNKTSDSIN